MNSINKYLNKNSPYSFVIRFLCGFAVLYYFFPLYRGITGSGGYFYSSFLDSHFNIIKAISGFLASAASKVLEIFNYNVFYKSYHSFRIENSPGVVINPSCLGWGVMSFWVAFVFANEGNIKSRSKWILTGLASIVLLNISRIIMVALAGHHQWLSITSLDHHQTFNIIAYCFVIALTVLFIKKHQTNRKTNLSGNDSEYRLSSV